MIEKYHIVKYRNNIRYVINTVNNMEDIYDSIKLLYNKSVIHLGYICYGLFHSNIFDNKYEDGIYMINEDNDDITVYKVVDKRVADSDIYEIIREEIYGINTKKPRR